MKLFIIAALMIVSANGYGFQRPANNAATDNAHPQQQHSPQLPLPGGPHGFLSIMPWTPNAVTNNVPTNAGSHGSQPVTQPPSGNGALPAYSPPHPSAPAGASPDSKPAATASNGYAHHDQKQPGHAQSGVPHSAHPAPTTAPTQPSSGSSNAQQNYQSKPTISQLPQQATSSAAGNTANKNPPRAGASASSVAQTSKQSSGYGAKAPKNTQPSVPAYGGQQPNGNPKPTNPPVTAATTAPSTPHYPTIAPAAKTTENGYTTPKPHAVETKKPHDAKVTSYNNNKQASTATNSVQAAEQQPAHHGSVPTTIRPATQYNTEESAGLTTVARSSAAPITTVAPQSYGGASRVTAGHAASNGYASPSTTIAPHVEHGHQLAPEHTQPAPGGHASATQPPSTTAAPAGTNQHANAYSHSQQPAGTSNAGAYPTKTPEPTTVGGYHHSQDHATEPTTAEYLSSVTEPSQPFPQLAVVDVVGPGPALPVGSAFAENPSTHEQPHFGDNVGNLADYASPPSSYYIGQAGIDQVANVEPQQQVSLQNQWKEQSEHQWPAPVSSATVPENLPQYVLGLDAIDVGTPNFGDAFGSHQSAIPHESAVDLSFGSHNTAPYPGLESQGYYAPQSWLFGDNSATLAPQEPSFADNAGLTLAQQWAAASIGAEQFGGEHEAAKLTIIEEPSSAPQETPGSGYQSLAAFEETFPFATPLVVQAPQEPFNAYRTSHLSVSDEAKPVTVQHSQDQHQVRPHTPQPLAYRPNSQQRQQSTNTAAAATQAAQPHGGQKHTSESNRPHEPSKQGTAGASNHGQIYQQPANRPTTHGASNDGHSSSSSGTAPIAIISSESVLNEDGSFSYKYEAEDGTKVEASGRQKQVGPNPENVGSVSKGSYSYINPDGITISVTWVADENGFQATGDHLPTPPPLPDHVVKLLASKSNGKEESRFSKFSN